MRFAVLSVVLATISICAAEPAAREISKELKSYLARDENALDIGNGALLICKEEYPDLDIATQKKLLDDLAADLSASLKSAQSLEQKCATLKDFLFEKKQFGLPKKDDAAAFLLSDVLKNKRGNCLGLSVLCLALAERSGLKLFGVPIPSRLSGPGHLLVRFDDSSGRKNFDPTERGAEHPDEYYAELFKLTGEDLKRGYILKDAKRKDVIALLLINLGGARVERGEPAAALPLLESALTLRPDYAPAYNNLAAAKLRTGDRAKAESLYKKALEIDPATIGARLGLAEIKLMGGNASAEKDIAEVLKIEPDNIQAKTLLANIALNKNDYRSAITLLNDMAQAAPKDADIRCNLGRAYFLDGDYAGAERAYRSALEIDPENADAHCGLGRIFQVFGQNQQAETELAAAIKKQPGHVPTLLAIASAAQMARKTDAAITAYETILKSQPYQFEALSELSKLLISQGKTADAMQRLSAANKARPDDPAIAALLGDAKMSANDFTGALVLLRESLPKMAESARVPLLQRIAICYGKTQNHRLALENAEQILKLDPKDLTGLRIAAAASEGLQSKTKAVGFYKKVLEIDPDDIKARQALTRLGEK